MDQALKDARAALVRQIKRKPPVNRLASLAQVERGEKPSPAKWRPMPSAALQAKEEIMLGLLANLKRNQILGAPPPPDTLGGVYGTRSDVIWVDDLEDDAKYAGKVKIVDPDKYAGKVSAGKITPAVQPPPKLNRAWFGEYSQAILSPAPPKPDPTVTDKINAVATVDHEYEQFKVWLYRMIAEAQDDTSPAFVHSVAKIKFQPLRQAVAKVVALGALGFMKEDQKRRLVEFQKWVDGVKTDEGSWQVTGKGLLSNIARVIDPYAT